MISRIYFEYLRGYHTLIPLHSSVAWVKIALKWKIVSANETVGTLTAAKKISLFAIVLLPED